LSVGGSEGRLTTSPLGVSASHSGSVVDTSPSAATAGPTAAAAAAAACNVMSWSASDVARWLHHHDLDSLVDRLLRNAIISYICRIKILFVCVCAVGHWACSQATGYEIQRYSLSVASQENVGKLIHSRLKTQAVNLSCPSGPTLVVCWLNWV